ncbi:MAG: hypothetical protein ACR2GY_09190 [Phycisphaerales bacterium]
MWKKLAAYCALVAIGLQVVIAAQGGRLCYSAPLAPVDDCASGCCHLDEPAAQIRNVHAVPWSMTPDGPVDSDCCIEQHSHGFAVSSAQPNLKHVTVPAILPPMPAQTWLALRASSSIERYTGRDGPQPPSMRVIRTTVLLI